MKKELRNIITLSNMDPELEEWARAEAERSKKPFYQVVNEALEVLRLASERLKGDKGRPPEGA